MPLLFTMLLTAKTSKKRRVLCQLIRLSSEKVKRENPKEL